MKKNYFLFFAIFISLQLNAQRRIKFSYDPAGNQTRRVVVNTNPRMAADSFPKTSATTKDNDYIDDGLLNGIKYYPNPVREELFLKWKNTAEKTIAEITLYNINGQLVSKLSKLENSENQTISFHALTQGVYTMLVLYGNGKNESFKIVKN